MIDLRSDTVTRPTPAMRRAMAEAEVGDDVFREDPTVRTLQEQAAEIMGKEAALFVPSGTMGNQIAVRLHTSPGQEVLTEARGHVFNWELGMMAAFSGCLARPIKAPKGILSWPLIEAHLPPDVYYRAPVGLVVLENTHNMAGGTVMTSEETRDVAENAHRKGISVHLDGARIFNAATSLQCSPAELAEPCDSVMFCLSKALSSPVGSILAGREEFIEEAWTIRKMLGGGMRQVGVLAAAGLVALHEMTDRLEEDHSNARHLAEGLSELTEFLTDSSTVQTNIVIVDLNSQTSADVLTRLRDSGVLAVPTGPRQIRFVTHKDVSRDDIQRTLEIARRLFV